MPFVDLAVSYLNKNLASPVDNVLVFKGVSGKRPRALFSLMCSGRHSFRASNCGKSNLPKPQGLHSSCDEREGDPSSRDTDTTRTLDFPCALSFSVSHLEVHTKLSRLGVLSVQGNICLVLIWVNTSRRKLWERVLGYHLIRLNKHTVQ